MIRPCSSADLDTIDIIINEAAEAYRDVIPADCWHEPYMTRAHLEEEIMARVAFQGYEDEGVLVGVMGLQKSRDATLIRHAYVRSSHQGRGIGGALMSALTSGSTGPLLVGTWAAATWAIRFYEKHGFQLATPEETDRRLRLYWTVSPRQRETSVVLTRSLT